MAGKNFKQGRFTPRNPEKYQGDVDNITYRSSWELKSFEFFDNNPNILRWSSEEIAIPYIKPTDGKVHRYYPDIWVEYKNRQGDVVQEIIEIKPAKETKRSKSKNPKQKLYEDVTYAINTAKWQYAQKWCNERNITFRIVTENQMFR